MCIYLIKNVAPCHCSYNNEVQLEKNRLGKILTFSFLQIIVLIYIDEYAFLIMKHWLQSPLY